MFKRGYPIWKPSRHGNKKEKTSNNVLKSPLHSVKQSCSWKEEEEMQSVVYNANITDLFQ